MHATIAPAFPKPWRLARPPPGRSGVDRRARSPAKRARNVSASLPSRATASCASRKSFCDSPETSQRASSPTKAVARAICAVPIPAASIPTALVTGTPKPAVPIAAVSIAMNPVNQKGLTSIYQARCSVDTRATTDLGATSPGARAAIERPQIRREDGRHRPPQRAGATRVENENYWSSTASVINNRPAEHRRDDVGTAQMGRGRLSVVGGHVLVFHGRFLGHRRLGTAP